MTRTDPHESSPVSSLLTLRTRDPVSAAVLSAQMVKLMVSVSPEPRNDTGEGRVIWTPAWKEEKKGESTGGGADAKSKKAVTSRCFGMITAFAALT